MLSPALAPGFPNSFKQQLQNEAFDMFSLPNEISSPSGDLNYHSTFERDEIHMSNTHHQQRRSSYQQAEESMQSVRHGSVNGYGPVSMPDLQNSEFLGVFDGSFAHRDQDNRSDHLPYNPSNVLCASCTTNRQNQASPSLGTCRCSEVIVIQLSLLPALLQNHHYDFDVELVQFQEAIKLCTGVLACDCVGKDYTSVLAISLLISRILSVVERGAGCASHRELGFPVEIVGNSSANKSPKISLGRYQIDEEDERNLMQEMWGLQVKKVEVLIAGFKETVTKAKQQEQYQDVVQAAAWEKLHFLLDQKAQTVKREWAANRGKR